MRTVQLCVCMVMLLATNLNAQTDTTIKQAAPTLDLHAALGTNLGARFGLRYALIQPVTLEISYGVELGNVFGTSPEINVYNLVVNWHLRTPRQIVLSVGIGYGLSTTVDQSYVRAIAAAGWYSTTSSGLYVYPRIGFYILKNLTGNDHPERLQYDLLGVIDISFGYAFF